MPKRPKRSELARRRKRDATQLALAKYWPHDTGNIATLQTRARRAARLHKAEVRSGRWPQGDARETEFEFQIEDIFSTDERVPHRKGFKEGWRPTRERYWRPTNNNWKRHRETQYEPL